MKSGAAYSWPKTRCSGRPRPPECRCPNIKQFYREDIGKSPQRSNPRALGRRMMMKANEKNNGSAMGLDVGTSRICLALRVGEEYQYKTQLNAFVALPYSRITESVLKKEGVPHSVSGSEIVVHGNESEKFAE